MNSTPIIYQPHVIRVEDDSLTALNAEALAEKISAAVEGGKIYIVLDFENVRMIDSSALGMLVRMIKPIFTKGGDLKLAALDERVRGIMQLMRLHKVFDIHKSVASATGSFTIPAGRPAAS